jgi:hypothetical protein
MWFTSAARPSDQQTRFCWLILRIGSARKSLTIRSNRVGDSVAPSPFLNLFPKRVQQTLADGPLAGQRDSGTARAICEREHQSFDTARCPLGSHYAITLEAINGQSGESLARQLAAKQGQVLRALSQAATGTREAGRKLRLDRQFDRLVRMPLPLTWRRSSSTPGPLNCRSAAEDWSPFRC